MKKILIIITILVFATNSYSQQLALYSMYFNNNYVINPAAAGSNKDYSPLRLSIHRQWVGIDQTPSTQVISCHHLLSNKEMGIGGMIFHDSFGPVRTIGSQFTYAYHLRATRGIKVAFGVSAILMQYIISLDQEDFHSFEPVLLRNRMSILVPDGNLGAYAYSKKWWAGLSVAHIFQSNLKITSTYMDEKSNKMVRHYFLNGGYRFSFPSAKSLQIEPSSLIKCTETTPIQIDLNIRMIYNEDYWAGMSIRPGDSFIFMIGMNYKGYYFAFSHDFTFSELSNFTIGSEELTFGWNIGDKSYKSSRFY